MPITSCNTQEDTVVQRLEAYLGLRGLALLPADQAEIRAMLNGHANAADRALFEAREHQLRIMKLDVRDVPAGGYVNEAVYSLEGPVLATSSGPDVATKAKTAARSLCAPVLVCDGNDTVRATFDEPRSDSTIFAVKLSLGFVRDAQAASACRIAASVDILDCGLLNLRRAYAVFNGELDRLRKAGEHTGSVLFIENYEEAGQPIVHREIV